MLELARRGVVGATVALDPGGFWNTWQRHFLGVTLGLSIRLIRLLDPVMPFFTGNPIGRTLLLSELSARPWRLSPAATLGGMRSYAAALSFDAALHALVHGPVQQGMAPAAQRGPILIIWGRSDRVCLPSQAKCAMARFPGARLIWLEGCGHFPHWDRPEETVQMILAHTGTSHTCAAHRRA